jgi:hypothetical protein
MLRELRLVCICPSFISVSICLPAAHVASLPKLNPRVSAFDKQLPTFQKKGKKKKPRIWSQVPCKLLKLLSYTSKLPLTGLIAQFQ